MPSFVSGWCWETKIGAASEPPTLTQEEKNRSLREVRRKSSDFPKAAETHVNEGPAPAKEADETRRRRPAKLPAGRVMPGRVTDLLKGPALGESLTKAGLAPTLRWAPQSTRIVLPAQPVPPAQGLPAAPQSALPGRCCCAGREQMEEPRPPLSR